LKQVQRQPALALAQELQTVPRRPPLGLRQQAQLRSLPEVLPPESLVFRFAPWRARLLKRAQRRRRA
jgi:hypothetical protein